jgi:hypothetical protein
MIKHYPKITKEYFREVSMKLIEKNFDEIEPFFPSKSDFFHELVPLFQEINLCLIFECYLASITLTNHTLEKLLKLSLVYNDMGIIRRHLNQPDFYKNSHEKYQSSDLSKTINLTCSSGLITKEQKKYLENEVLEQLRNGFSHSDPKKIIEPNRGKKLYTAVSPDAEKTLKGLVSDPTFQSQMISMFAEKEAFIYYKKVVEISLHIQTVLSEKENKKA